MSLVAIIYDCLLCSALASHNRLHSLIHPDTHLCDRNCLADGAVEVSFICSRQNGLWEPHFQDLFFFPFSTIAEPISFTPRAGGTTFIGEQWSGKTSLKTRSLKLKERKEGASHGLSCRLTEQWVQGPRQESMCVFQEWSEGRHSSRHAVK